MSTNDSEALEAIVRASIAEILGTTVNSVADKREELLLDSLELFELIGVLADEIPTLDPIVFAESLTSAGTVSLDAITRACEISVCY